MREREKAYFRYLHVVVREQLSEVMTFAQRPTVERRVFQAGRQHVQRPRGEHQPILCGWSIVGEETELERWAGARSHEALGLRRGDWTLFRAR